MPANPKRQFEYMTMWNWFQELRKTLKGKMEARERPSATDYEAFVTIRRWGREERLQSVENNLQLFDNLMRHTHIGSWAQEYKVTTFSERDVFYVGAPADAWPPEQGAPDDWQGVYVTPDVGVALGYASEHLYAGKNAGIGNGYIIKVSPKRAVKVYNFTTPIMGRPSISTFDKTRELKAVLGIAPKDHFIGTIDERGFVYQGVHDEEGGLEIVLGQRMVNDFQKISSATLKFKGSLNEVVSTDAALKDAVNNTRGVHV